MRIDSNNAALNKRIDRNNSIVDSRPDFRNAAADVSVPQVSRLRSFGQRQRQRTLAKKGFVRHAKRRN